MPDEINVPAPAVIAPTEPPKPVVLASSLPEDALKTRLDQAKRTGKAELLNELGVSSAEELQTAIAAHKATLEAQKTAEQKAIEREAALNEASRQLGEYKAAVDSTWATEAGRLTAEQLEAVTTVAGENPAARLRALNALRKTWGTPAVAAPAAPPPAPATTSPNPGAPPPAGTQGTDNPMAVYEQLSKLNPIAAARYAVAHSRELFPDQ